MNPTYQLFTAIFVGIVFLGFPVLVLLIDLWIYRNRGDEYTISRCVLRLYQKWPVLIVLITAYLAMGIGILIGHLLLPQHI